MEKNLHNWYVEKKARGEIITAKMIKEKAIQLTNCSDFIASKGWLDKFKVRYNLEISKESAKEGHKRRSIPSLRNRGMERVTSYPPFFAGIRGNCETPASQTLRAWNYYKEYAYHPDSTVHQSRVRAGSARIEARNTLSG